MAKDLLLEIGTEEIPAGFIRSALKQLEKLADDVLHKNRITHKEIKVWGTPRRLSLYVAGVDENQSPSPPRWGPSIDAPYEHRKRFAEKYGKSVGDLLTEKTPKGERVYIVIPGESVSKVLPKIIPQLIQSLPFPKSMRWNEGDFRFARPIHWIMALFGAEVIKFEVAEIKSSNQSYGHRFLAPHSFIVTDLKTYEKELKKHFVIVDQEQRRAEIAEQLERVSRQLAKKYPGAKVIEDDELLDEVTYLVEYPVAVVGQFDKEFMELPHEVLTTTLKHHQKCFSAEDGNGELLPVFITISNMPDNKGYIGKGNERVIRARLADARFFYQEDQKIKLQERIEGLKGVIFQEKLGSYYDKQKRVEHLLTPETNISVQLANLYKADLLTEMVQEFPKLQGIMGEQYLRLEGQPEELAVAVREHYLPRFAGDSLPQTELGAALSIADKIDTIVGCFGVGLLPSGSQDPYALRRQANGVINIILTNQKLIISLENLVERALHGLNDKLTRPAEVVKKEVMDYFESRVDLIFCEAMGYRHDLVNAVLISGFDNVLDAKLRLEALNQLSQQPDFDSLMIAFRRVVRIIPSDYKPAQVAPDLLQEETERVLHSQFQQIKAQVEQLLNKRNYADALKTLASLKPNVDCFFNDVLVMVDEEALRNNRLSLLFGIKSLFSQIADFSKIVVQ